MKKLVSQILIIGVFAAVGFGQESVWKEYRSDELFFKVAFPGVPKVSRTQADATTREQFQVAYEGQSFLIFVSDDPNAPESPTDRQLRDRYAAVVASSAPDSDREIYIGGMLGHEMVKERNGILMTTRFFILHGRHYQVLTGLLKSAADDPQRVSDARKFVESFVITNPPKPRFRLEAFVDHPYGSVPQYLQSQ